jgi:hypothetical protein
MALTALDFIGVSQVEWEIRVQVHLRPRVKRDCHSSEFCKSRACCTISVKKHCIDFHENLMDSLFADTRLQIGGRRLIVLC